MVETDIKKEGENGAAAASDSAGGAAAATSAGGAGAGDTSKPATSRRAAVTRDVSDFEQIEFVGQGAYGKVWLAKDKASNELVALKKVLMDQEREGFPFTALREIRLLKSMDHPNVVKLREIVTSKANDYNQNKGSVYLVFEYLEHDLAGIVSSGAQLSRPVVKLYMKQLLEGLHYCHLNNILHRDLKLSNLLISNSGIVKIADFGLARRWTDKAVPLTSTVITQWYRPPELLLQCTNYGAQADMWSVGCILAELLIGTPIMPADKGDQKQLECIFKMCGTPTEESWPGMRSLPLAPVMSWISHGNYKRKLREHIRDNLKPSTPPVTEPELDLTDKLLSLDPDKRPTAGAALDHEYFYSEPLPATTKDVPTFSDHHHDWQEKKKRKQKEEANQKKRQTHGGGAHPHPHASHGHPHGGGGGGSYGVSGGR